MKESGILLHITSLPSRGGIGDLGDEAFRFADFLKASGVTVWQVLPLGPTGYGESPYQSPSTFAGNPLLISVEKLISDGIFSGNGLPEAPVFADPSEVDYEAVRLYKDACLRVCFRECAASLKAEIDAFCASRAWVRDFALFMAVKQHFDNVMWTKWPDKAIQFREKNAVAEYTEKLREEIEYHIFCQYLFQRQWQELKAYCNSLGIRIFGDVPIYVAEDSADTWTHPEIFQLDRNRIPKRVAGVPPDLFTADGQMWGNPLYRWHRLRLTGYRWWVERMTALSERFDLIRIDHFIGFANYYSIPYGAPNARNGKWVIGPGFSLFRVLRAKLPSLNIVAEDLGCVNDRVRKLLRQCGYPGMKVLSFGFGGNHDDNPHYPSAYPENTIAYTGTHDNDTVIGWVNSADEASLADARETLGFTEAEDAPMAFIRRVFAADSRIAVIPMQDWLGLDTSARMNYPGTVGGNWKWRLTPDQLTPDLSRKILETNTEYQRGGNPTC